jgi:mono/diheme cytochrome c family protein
MESDMNCFKGFVVLLVAAGAAGLVTVYSGIIDVGASNPHGFFTRWLLNTTMERSVRVHARGIKLPPLDDPRMVMQGFRHYREMCVGCHLAPGVTATEIRKGLMPRPPELQESVDDWTPAELFWVTKNGVKMTGMPAWGATHTNSEIWAIVAFLEKLPHMSAEQYAAMDKSAGEGRTDDHAPGVEPDEHHRDASPQD